MTEAGRYKYFFNAWNPAQALQQTNLPGMIDLKQRTDLRIQASFAGAGALRLFSGAVDAIHVGCRPADVRKVTFKMGDHGYLPGFRQDAFFTAAENSPAFMQSDGAEAAFPEAAPVRR